MPNRSPPATQCALGPALFNVGQDLLELALIDLRTLLGGAVERVAQLAILASFGKLFDHLVVDRLLNQQPAARAAALALIQEQPEHGPFDGRIEVGVGEDDVRALAAKLESHALERIGRILHDQLAGRGLTREGNLVDALVAYQRGASRLAEAGDDVDHTRGIACFQCQFAHPQRGERGLLGRLEHDGTACRQRRPPFPGNHQHGEVPGDDLADHAQRLAPTVAEVIAANRNRLAMDLVGPARVVAQAIDHQRQVAVAALVDRLAVVQSFQLGQLVDVLFDQLRELVHQPAAVARVHLLPRAAVERLARP